MCPSWIEKTVVPFFEIEDGQDLYFTYTMHCASEFDGRNAGLFEGFQKMEHLRIYYI